MKSRLHIYPHSEPGGNLYIIGERRALRELGQTLLDASKNVLGMDNTELYTSDGHQYTLVAISSVTEEEWQLAPPPYQQLELPEFETVRDFQELQAKLINV